jgi:Uri superfamily endonuclease
MSNTPGTYILVLHCDRCEPIEVGRLGQLEVQPGYYLYIGSAFGPGGVAARIKHHRKPANRPHWHIDYLRRVCELVDVRCVYNEKCEHDWARRLANTKAVTSPFAVFGSSDCDCYSHLFFSNGKPDVKLWRALSQGMPLEKMNQYVGRDSEA